MKRPIYNILFLVIVISFLAMVAFPVANALTTLRVEIDDDGDGNTDRIETWIDYDDDGTIDERIQGEIIKEETIDKPSWSQETGDVIEDISSSFLDRIDGIVVFIAIILSGVLVAWVVKIVTVKLLRRVRFDFAMERVGINRFLRSFKGASGFVGFFVFWYFS